MAIFFIIMIYIDNYKHFISVGRLKLKDKKKLPKLLNKGGWFVPKCKTVSVS